MAVPRIKRTPEILGELTGPPPSPSRPNVFVEVFEPLHIDELVAGTGIQNDAIVSVACELNQTFSDYANGAAMEADSIAVGNLIRWLKRLAARCTALLRHLGYPEDSGAVEGGAWDALYHLTLGLPPELLESLDRERLNHCLNTAMPYKYSGKGPPDSKVDLDDYVQSIIGSLGPSLVVLREVALSAAGFWAKQIKRSGSSRNRARRHLIKLLITLFAKLFGRVPESSPGSRGYEWVSAVIKVAGRLAGEHRARFKPASTPESQAYARALDAIESLARHIGPPSYKTETEGKSKLEHWMREALRDRKSDGSSRLPPATTVKLSTRE